MSGSVVADYFLFTMQIARPNLLSNTNRLLDIYFYQHTSHVNLFSGHCPVTTSFHVSTLPSFPRHCTNVRKNDYLLLRQFLDRYSLMDRITGTDNANFFRHSWYTHLEYLVLRSTVWSWVPIHKRKSWFTPRLYRYCLSNTHSLEIKVS